MNKTQVCLAATLLASLIMPGLCAGQDLLSSEERAWLADHPLIRLAPDPDFPPIEYLDKQGEYHGIAADFVALLEQKLDMQISIVALPSWDDVLLHAQQRGVDMLGAATSTPQRESYMHFSEPHIELPGVILVRTLVQEELTLDQLHGLKVAIVSGYVWQELIARDHPEILIEPVPDLLTGLKKLSFGTVDAMVANLATATYYIGKAGITNLRVAGESGYFGRYAFGVRNDWPELSTILTKGLAAISEQERAAILNRWVGLQQQSIWSNPLIWLYLAAGAGLFLALSTLVWIWLLRRQVAKRTAEVRNELAQRQQAEQARHRSEQRYGTLFNAASDAVFIMEAERIIDCNAVASRLFGCRRAELVGQVLHHYSPAIQSDGCESEREALALVKQALAGTAQIFEWQYRRSDGSTFDAEVSLTAFSDGAQQHILAIIRDITERKRIERMKDEFISTVSHEIRTPLTSIRGSLGLIVGGAVDTSSGKLTELIDIAHSNTERLLALVNDLLDTQKLESGQVEFSFAPVDVETFLGNAVETNRAFAEQHQVALQRLPLAQQCTINADDDRLLQVMTNLLSNAIKFSPKGQSVEVRAEQRGAALRISVSDRGPGIPSEFRQRLFERFSQADATDTRQVGGTGLGLSIAKAIVEKHDGHIAFENRPGGGTTFYFELPLRDGNG
jgi:PAS domain S-box-containing protein